MIGTRLRYLAPLALGVIVLQSTVQVHADTGLELSRGMWVGSGATATTVDSSGESVFTVSASGQLSRIDVASRSVVASVTVAVPQPNLPAESWPIDVPRSLAVHPESGLVYVPSQVQPIVYVYDPVSLTQLDAIAAGESGFSAAEFGQQDVLYLGSTVGSFDGLGHAPGMIIKLDMAQRAVTWTSAALPAAVLELVVDEQADQAFFVGHDGRLRHVDLATSRSQVVVPTVTQSALGLVLDEKSRRLYIAMRSGVHVLDVDSLSIESVWKATRPATGVALALDHKVAYVARRDRLSVVAINTGKIITNRKVKELGLGWGFGQYFESNGRSPTLSFIENFSTIRLATLGRMVTHASRKAEAG